MLLGIETAAELVGVAIADAHGPLAASWVRGERRHAETLAPAISHVLAQVGASLGDVEAIAVDTGPGLFTGIRVGVATAQGLALGLGVGVVQLSSVDILARAIYEAGWTGPVAAVVDARRGEVFCARYAGPETRTQPPSRWAPDELAAALAEQGPRNLVLVGTGARRYGATFSRWRVAATAEPSPRALLRVAMDRLARGEVPLPPAQVRPTYLRPPDARIHWEAR